jgi:DNA-binding transcriptional regulator YiaG
MAGQRKFSELRAGMSPERRKRNRLTSEALIAEMPLQELRRARELSQATLAEALETDQGNISKLEQRTDMYISTLRRYVEAMGGTLEIVAKFPDGAVRVTQFHELAKVAGE